jgi:hypothetical protein
MRSLIELDQYAVFAVDLGEVERATRELIPLRGSRSRLATDRKKIVVPSVDFAKLGESQWQRACG